MKLDWPFEFPGAYWLDQQEDDAVLDVLHNGSLFRYYGLGEPQYVDRFEAAARAFYVAKFALAVNSGTGALMTAMSALGVSVVFMAPDSYRKARRRGRGIGVEGVLADLTQVTQPQGVRVSAPYRTRPSYSPCSRARPPGYPCRPPGMHDIIN